MLACFQSEDRQEARDVGGSVRGCGLKGRFLVTLLRGEKQWM